MAPREYRIKLDPSLDPWERQPKETPRQYGRFILYRDLGRSRALTTLNKLLTELGDPLTYLSLRRYSSDGSWTARAEAWDAYQDRQDHEQNLADRREMIKRHRNIATGLMSKAAQALRKFAISDMTPADIARYVKLATDIERTAIGMPQQTVAITGPTGGPIQTEDLTDLTPAERRQRLAEIAAELSRRAGVEDTGDDD
jgi:hypothetical protein